MFKIFGVTEFIQRIISKNNERCAIRQTKVSQTEDETILKYSKALYF